MIAITTSSSMSVNPLPREALGASVRHHWGAGVPGSKSSFSPCSGKTCGLAARGRRCSQAGCPSDASLCSQAAKLFPSPPLEERARERQGCSKLRPVEGRSCSAALKSEDRRPKSEFREWSNSIGGCSAGVAINSDFGLRVAFGLRSSDLGFGMARTDFRAALRESSPSFSPPAPEMPL